VAKARARKRPQPRADEAAIDEPIDAAFDSTLVLQEQTYAALSSSFNHEVYDEYLGELDKVPVLRDPVARPRPALQADFRQGQRPDARRESRPDAHSLREAHDGDLLSLYTELTHAAASPRKPAKRTKRRRAKKKTK